MGRKPWLDEAVVAVALVAAACGGTTPTAGPPVPWTGARALTAREDGPRYVATDGTRVFFTTGRTQVGENALRVASLDGAEAASRLVATTPGGRIPNGNVALDGDTVYVAADFGIVRMPAAGGEATVVVDGRPGSVDDVVATDTDLWWTTWVFDTPKRCEVARMPKTGGPVEVLAVDVASGLGRPYPDGDTALLASPKGVLRVAAGEAPEVVAGSDLVGGAVTGLAMDDDAALRPRRRRQAPAARHPPGRRRPGRAGRRRELRRRPRRRRRRGPVLPLGGRGGVGRSRQAAGGAGDRRRRAHRLVRDLRQRRPGRGRRRRVVFSADDQVWVASVRG